MWKIFSQNTVSEIQSENQHNLAWSLKPIFYCLAVFGIDLDVSVARSVFRRYCFITLGITNLVFMQALNINFYFLKIRVEPFDIKSMTTWLTFLKLLIWGAWDIFFPLTSFYSYFFKWEKFFHITKNCAEHFQKYIGRRTSEYNKTV